MYEHKSNFFAAGVLSGTTSEIDFKPTASILSAQSFKQPHEIATDFPFNALPRHSPKTYSRSPHSQVTDDDLNSHFYLKEAAH